MARAQARFSILLETPQGERRSEADAVIDVTGTYGQPRWLGTGGLPALGESVLRKQLQYHLPDIAGADRAGFADRHTVVIGSGYSAATAVVALVELSQDHPRTRVTWLTRAVGDPLPEIADDPLSARRELRASANAVASGAAGAVDRRGGGTVQQIVGLPGGGYELHLQGTTDERLVADQVLALVGYRPDTRLFSELQVHLCYASEGPMALAAALAAHDSHDCLRQPEMGSDCLQTSEPHFYLLGSKSYGRNSQFLLKQGFAQIRQLFALIADRADLDLYRSIRPLAGNTPLGPSS
jgi:hypothetical protein